MLAHTIKQTITRRLLPTAFIFIFAAMLSKPLNADIENVIRPPYNPLIQPASDEGEKLISKFKPVAGMHVELIAAEPHLVNPVCFTIDHKGRIYVAETFRLHAGVTDMRGHMSWLADDQACRTVEDRLNAMKKNLGFDFIKYNVEDDRIRILLDNDGDGKTDEAKIFADGFNDRLDGIGAGILVDRGDVYWTCIPDLWKLRDTTGDNTADERIHMSGGFGVHIGFLGHDLHGLRKGPDGRIYFSIGDRGFNVVNKEGKRLYSPDCGAVLRCEPDGSNLEIFHDGLRNPQEIVFDDYGNLFTGDNNSDAGDKARWVYLVEGGYSGWTYGYQWFTKPVARGSWNAEKMWHPQWKGQTASIVPPLANIGAGPSGLTYYPGTGLPERYAGHFFMADFRGNAFGSLVHSFSLTPKGAAFEVGPVEEFIKGVCLTDLEFGMKPGLYISDWVTGWEPTGKGRIYRIHDPNLESDAGTSETARLLGEGFDKRATEELVSLLGNRDQRVRLEAQWALADKGTDALPALRTAAASATGFGRLHSVWALAQLGRAGNADATQIVERLLDDSDAEIRAQAARAMSDLRAPTAQPRLIAMLKDESARCRFFAATALGKLDPAKAAPENARPALVEMLKENKDEDPYLRHAGVMGLAGSQNPNALLAAAQASDSAAVRMGCLLALRRHESPFAANFLNDSDPLVVTEAARVINDLPINGAMEALAIIASKVRDYSAWREMGVDINPLLLRVLNANFRLGGAGNAKAVGIMAAEFNTTDEVRIEALTMLAEWAGPHGPDRVKGEWRPLAARSDAPAREVATKIVPKILAGKSPKIIQSAAQLAGQYKIAEAADALLAIVSKTDENIDSRIESIRALGKIGGDQLTRAVAVARADSAANLRTEGNTLFAQLNPEQAIAILTQALERGEVSEKQGAITTLASLKTPQADALLGQWLDKLLANEVPNEMKLEILDTARASENEAVKSKSAEWDRRAKAETTDTLAGYRESLYGGKAENGKKIFFEKVEAQCQKCHKIGETGGGEVGPDLTTVASRVQRDYILESIVKPNQVIAKGFENVTLILDDDSEVAGRVVTEDETKLELEIAVQEEGEEFVEEEADTTVPAESKPATEVAHGEPEPAKPTQYTRMTIEVAKIKKRTRNLSSMPEDLLENLSKSELRDLVEYLSSLKEEAK